MTMNRQIDAGVLRDALLHREIRQYRALVPVAPKPQGVVNRLRRALVRRNRNIDDSMACAARKFLAVSHEYLRGARRAHRIAACT